MTFESNSIENMFTPASWFPIPMTYEQGPILHESLAPWIVFQDLPIDFIEANQV